MSKDTHETMTQGPIPRVLLSLALPTMASMLMTSIYQIADTFYVASLGTQATAAVGITFALTSLIQAVGFTLGMGGGSLISLSLGKQEKERASQIASTSFYLALLLGIGIALALGARDPILTLLGANDQILPYARDYSFFLFLSAPLFTGSLCLSHLLRSEGHTGYVMRAIVSSGLLSLVLSPLLMRFLGIQGISLATLLSQLLCLCLLLYPFFRKKTVLSLRLFPFRASSLRLLPSILFNGLPSLLRQGLAAVSAALLSRAATAYGAGAVAGMSIAGKIFMIVLTLMLGYGQGLQPLLGYNYAQGLTRRVRGAALFCLWTGTAGLVLLAAVCFLQAPFLISLFSTEEEVQAIALLALRAGALTMPLLGICTIVNLGFQAIKRPVIATFLASARQGLFFIPLIFLLPPALGLLGVQIAQAVADAATFVLSVPFLLYFFRKAVDKKNGKV